MVISFITLNLLTSVNTCGSSILLLVHNIPNHGEVDKFKVLFCSVIYLCSLVLNSKVGS